MFGAAADYCGMRVSPFLSHLLDVTVDFDGDRALCSDSFLADLELRNRAVVLVDGVL